MVIEISTDLQKERIKKYAYILEEIFYLESRVEIKRNELKELAEKMTQDDINDANLILSDRGIEK